MYMCVKDIHFAPVSKSERDHVCVLRISTLHLFLKVSGVIYMCVQDIDFAPVSKSERAHVYVC
jgi:hypothetical protein